MAITWIDSFIRRVYCRQSVNTWIAVREYQPKFIPKRRWGEYLVHSTFQKGKNRF